MWVPIICSSTFLLFLFFGFLFFANPSFSLSCPIHPSCDSKIDIYYPFYTNNSGPGCNGTFMIHCTNSTPTIQLPDYLLRSSMFTVKDISYPNRTIIVQYQQDTTVSALSVCSFLFNFARPIPHVDRPHLPILDDMDKSVSSCTWGKDDFPLLALNYNYSVCKDFSFYYWSESDKGIPKTVPSTCQARTAPLFELKLSFAKSDEDGLSLLSAGSSHYLELRPDCFEENTCSSNSLVKDSRRRKKKKKTIIGVTVLAGFILIIFSLLYVGRSKFHNSNILWMKNLHANQNVEAFLEKYGSLAPKRYMYSDVKKITESFRDILGQGGFGTVFRGSLSNGRLVAVKVLSNSKGNGEDFVNEIASIGMSSHVNIVKLLGFCSEGSKRALIYEYMCNGSLDKLICSGHPKTTLDWTKLYQIAIGIARGLEYLHRGCNTRIVHFDIKPHNILLDEDFCPKISDFGLAKLCIRKDSILSSMEGARGTIGYIAPEIFYRNFGVISSKSDIYSYGMMVLEMAGGRQKTATTDVQDTSEINFPNRIYEHLEQNGDLQTCYGATAETEELVRKMVLVGLWCIQTLPQNRPSITRVIEMLEGSINDLQIPPKPYLLFPSSVGSTLNNSSVQDGDCRDYSLCAVH